MRPLPRAAEECLPRGLVAMNGGHFEVVPRRPVEVHGNGSQAERLGDRPSDRFEQCREILTRPQEAGDFEESPQR